MKKKLENFLKRPGVKKMIVGALLMVIGFGLMFAVQKDEKTVALNITSTLPQKFSVFRSVPYTATKADVMEFFWYGCPHCLKLEKAFIDQNYESRLARVVRPDGKSPTRMKIPAAMSPLWELHARLYFALEKAGVTESTHFKVMEIFSKNIPKTNKQIEEVLNELASSVSIDVSKIMTDMYSQETNLSVSHSVDLSKSIGIQGVPSILIDGNKVVELGKGMGYTDVSEVILLLMKKDRG